MGSKKIVAVSEEEYRRMFDEVCQASSLGDLLRKFAGVVAGDDESGEIENSEAYRKVARPYLRARDTFPEEALRHGLEAAIRYVAGSFNYVTTSAERYVPPTGGPRRVSKGVEDQSGSGYDPQDDFERYLRKGGSGSSYSSQDDLESYLRKRGVR